MHLRPCLVLPLCGASRSFRNCCWLWGIQSSLGAAHMTPLRQYGLWKWMNAGFVLCHNIQSIRSQTTCHCPGFYLNSTRMLSIFTYLKESRTSKPRLLCRWAKNLYGVVVKNHCAREHVVKSAFTTWKYSKITWWSFFLGWWWLIELEWLVFEEEHSSNGIGVTVGDTLKFLVQLVIATAT